MSNTILQQRMFARNRQGPRAESVMLAKGEHMRVYIVEPSLYTFLAAHARILDEVAASDEGRWIKRMDIVELYDAACRFFDAPLRREGNALLLFSAMQEQPFRLQVHEAFLELDGKGHDPFMEWIMRRFRCLIKV